MKRNARDRQRLLHDLRVPPTPSGLLHAAGHLRGQGDLESAVTLYREVLSLEPSSQVALRELAALLRALGRPGEAAAALAQLRAAEADALFLLAQDWAARRGDDEASEYIRRALAIDPHHPGGRHLDAALRRGPVPDRAPACVARQIFDRLAPRYDWLSGPLTGRAAPDVLARVCRQLIGRDAGVLDVADLGCGTGLGIAGLTGRHRFVGVDASPLMLERAARKQIYCELHEADLFVWLSTRNRELDLILAVEAFGYTGALGDLMRAADRALRSRGLLVCAFEHASDPRYRLKRTGEYAHNPFYVRRKAAEAGFSSLMGRHFRLLRRADPGPWGDVLAFRRRA